MKKKKTSNNRFNLTQGIVMVPAKILAQEPRQRPSQVKRMLGRRFARDKKETKMDRLVYFSQRTGKNKNFGKIDLETLKKLFLTIFNMFYEKDYFLGTFGSYTHNDFRDEIQGPLGDDSDISDILFLKIRKPDLWPISSHINLYKEDDLFDIIEYCYDNISHPIIEFEEDKFTGYTENITGYSSEEGQSCFRQEVNKHLKDYAEGFEIDSNGYIVRLAGFGLEPLFDAKLPTKDNRISEKIEHAISKYRNRNSSLLDRREAVRNLADVFEYIRPQVKAVINKKDENDLFNIANEFGIRHNNRNQKIDYDENIWLSWMFYYYLATIHAFIRILNKEGLL
jgi:hypothetical protein